jgi:hypothetical protein
MFSFIIIICLLALFMPVLRFLFGLAILCIFYLVFSSSGSSDTTPATVQSAITADDAGHIMTYQELVAIEPSCEQKQDQLSQLEYIQKIKNFKEDPNDLDDTDRAYNSRLKATIWWYAYSCDQS